MTPSNVSKRRWGATQFFMLVLSLSLLSFGCGEAMDESPGDGEQQPIEVTGTYQTQFDTTETITESEWQAATIIEWSNRDNWAVTQNPSDAEFNADKFTKVVWTEPDSNGVFYYCTVDLGLDSAEAARTTDETADDSNPEQGGCADFPWTKMTPAEN